ncbi:MAG: hypothetical protein ABSB19_00135 [Methylomonas sp.]|jgi:hypothetical protein
MQNSTPAYPSPPKYKKILIVCPAHAMSGGPEALHHLADQLNRVGLNAFMCYLPFNRPAIAPEAYKRYVSPASGYEDSPGNLIIFPEVSPHLAMKVKYAQAALWWLSLDNFLERRHTWPLYDKFRYLKGVLKGRRPWNGVKSLSKLIHFSQSQHASSYLKSCGIEPVPLFEPINEDFLTDRDLLDSGPRQNVILYNPTKGKKITAKLIRDHPQFQFEPLRGFNREQLSEKFYSAKLYIDFGHHPGRERMPREAAMQGCCLITGNHGSAGNPYDLPIPARYKLDSAGPDFGPLFKALTQDIFDNFAEHSAALNDYRSRLKQEPAIFRQHINDYFFRTEDE